MKVNCLTRLKERVVQYCSKHTDGYFGEIIPTDGGREEGYVQRFLGGRIDVGVGRIGRCRTNKFGEVDVERQ